MFESTYVVSTIITGCSGFCLICFIRRQAKASGQATHNAGQAAPGVHGG